MKKQFAALLTALSLLPTLALAQEYYTLPEIREQAKDGWHETYTDKYGRETVVDIDVEVYGEETAPIIKITDAGYRVDQSALWSGEKAESSRFFIEKNYPYLTVENVKRKGGRRTHFFHTFGEAVDLDRMYGAELGNDLTVREMYEFMAAILERNGLNLNGDFEYAHPMEFDMMCNINQTTMQPVTPPFYYIRLWAKMNGLPIMTHAMRSFNKVGWPMYMPDFTMMMMNEESYSILLVTMKEAERVAEDIPLCPLQTVIENLEKEIESGHLQKLYTLRFGYALYNEPGHMNYRQDLEIDSQADYYAVPSWVMECAYMDNPKNTWVEYDDETLFKMDGADGNNRGNLGFRTLTINAQTGKMMDINDQSKDGFGDADYKGFIPWDKVKK